MKQSDSERREKAKANYRAHAEERKAYAVAWRKANPERAKATCAAYRKANPDRVKAMCADWRKNNPEKAKSGKDAYRNSKAGREKERAGHAAWRNANADRNKERVAAWFKANPEKARAYCHERRSAQTSAGGSYAPSDIDKLFALQKGKCLGCKCKISSDGKKKGTVKYTIDHVRAVKNGGSSWPTNLQLLCGSCNSRKNAKNDLEWANAHGRLFA